MAEKEGFELYVTFPPCPCPSRKAPICKGFQLHAYYIIPVNPRICYSVRGKIRGRLYMGYFNFFKQFNFQLIQLSAFNGKYGQMQEWAKTKLGVYLYTNKRICLKTLSDDLAWL